MVIVVGNGLSELISNPNWDCFPLASHILTGLYMVKEKTKEKDHLFKIYVVLCTVINQIDNKSRQSFTLRRALAHSNSLNLTARVWWVCHRNQANDFGKGMNPSLSFCQLWINCRANWAFLGWTSLGMWWVGTTLLLQGTYWSSERLEDGLYRV